MTERGICGSFMVVDEAGENDDSSVIWLVTYGGGDGFEVVSRWSSNGGLVGDRFTARAYNEISSYISTNFKELSPGTWLPQKSQVVVEELRNIAK